MTQFLPNRTFSLEYDVERRQMIIDAVCTLPMLKELVLLGREADTPWIRASCDGTAWGGGTMAGGSIA